MVNLSKDKKRKRKLALRRKEMLTAKQNANKAYKKRKNIPVPDFIICNECGGHALKETFEILDSKGLAGIDLVLSGICSKCERPTIAVAGEPEAQLACMELLRTEMDIHGSMGLELAKNPE